MKLELTDDQVMITYHAMNLLRESTVASIGAIEALKNDKQVNLLESVDEDLQQANMLLKETDLIITKLETYIDESFTSEDNGPDITTKPEWDQ